MFIIQRYYIKEFIRLFLILSAGLASLFGVFDLIEKIDSFLPHNPSFSLLLYYAALTVPKYLLYLLPMVSLLSGLFIFSQASRARETVAVMASGGRLKRLVLPFLLIGVFISFFSFAVGEFLVPETSRLTRDLKRAITKTKSPSIFRQGTIWFRAKDGSIAKIDLYIEGAKSARGISIFEVDGEGIRQRIEADEASYKEGWMLKGVRIYDMQAGTVAELKELPAPALSSPELLEEEIRKPEEMGIVELRGYIERLNEAGLKNPKLSVDINSKLSYPVVNLIMIVLGISLSLRRKMGGLVSIAAGIFISLIYWFSYTLTLSLGYAGLMPPVLSAWSVPLMFGSAAGYLFRAMPE